MRTLVCLGLVLALLSPADARLRKPKRGFQVKMSKFLVRSGQDLEVCEYRRLPNKETIDVTGFDLRMPAGAHHFVIWGYGGDEEDDAAFPQGPVESVGCVALMQDDLIPEVVIPIQTPNAAFRFPPGLGLRLPAGKQVWLNAHMRNGAEKSITPRIRFNFHRARPGEVQHHLEGLIIGNTLGIRIPPRGSQRLTAEWTAPGDITIVQMATHQHQLGTYANIELVGSDGTPTKIYEETDWQHPHPYWPDPFVRLAKGDKMRITCEWQNPGDRTVVFGAETTDEMCFILGFYYRNDDTPLTGGGCLPTKSGLLCIGAVPVAD